MKERSTACGECKHFRDNREFQIDERLIGALCAFEDKTDVSFDMIEGCFVSYPKLTACDRYNDKGECPHFDRGYSGETTPDKMRIGLIDIVNLTGGQGLSDNTLGKINRVAHDALGNRSIEVAEDLMRRRTAQGTNPA